MRWIYLITIICDVCDTFNIFWLNLTTIENFLETNKNRQICTILKDKSVMQALVLMSEKNIGAIIVVDNNDFPVGIFSERDYARKIILKEKIVKIHCYMKLWPKN